ncbi:helix-turn-helix transcriptional regulator [Nitrospinota bacterium]
MTDTPRFLDQNYAATFLGNISPRTLERFRLDGRGPKFRKFGRRVIYAQGDLIEWADNHIHQSTSDYCPKN